MGARPIEARLTARMLAVSGVVLALVGISSVALTSRVLDRADTDAAMARAKTLHDQLVLETSVEGDAPLEAIDEVYGEGIALGDRSVLRIGTLVRGNGTPLEPGTCATSADDSGHQWRSCAVGDASIAATASVSMEAHHAAVLGLAKAMAIVMIAALALLALAVRRALREPVEEIHALVRWTSEITEKRTPPPEAATLEIEQLRTAFDALVQRLLEAIAREQAVTAHIAHELRVPLTTMLAELESAPTSDLASHLRSDAKRVADVVEAILVLSDRSKNDSHDAVVNVADVARELAPEGAAIEAPDEALTLGDERLIALAVRNLVDNARKYAGKARVVRVSRDDGAVRVTVVDDGPGLSEDARKKMFDRYWRGAADGDGRGLGLSLVRAIAERHGGRAEARPGPDDRGLEVSMTLQPIVGWHDAAR